MSEHYSKEYLDEVHGNHAEKLENMHQDIREIKKEVKHTNGKVKKIIIALVGVIFFALGLGLKEAAMLLKVLI